MLFNTWYDPSERFTVMRNTPSPFAGCLLPTASFIMALCRKTSFRSHFVDLTRCLDAPESTQKRPFFMRPWARAARLIACPNLACMSALILGDLRFYVSMATFCYRCSFETRRGILYVFVMYATRVVLTRGHRRGTAHLVADMLLSCESPWTVHVQTAL